MSSNNIINLMEIMEAIESYWKIQTEVTLIHRFVTSGSCYIMEIEVFGQKIEVWICEPKILHPTLRIYYIEESDSLLEWIEAHLKIPQCKFRFDTLERIEGRKWERSYTIFSIYITEERMNNQLDYKLLW